MTAPAAPTLGRRAGFGATAVLAAFLLLAPPLYLLGPFALLTLLSRPRSAREILFLALAGLGITAALSGTQRSEEHTSELQSHSEISYAVFCLKKKK